MNQTVTVEEKREFIRWFLKRYMMKRRESVWILNYLLSDDKRLERLHFVEEAHQAPRAMVMSVTESEGLPFRFYNGEIMSADAEKAFHELRVNPSEEMYLQLNFSNDGKAEFLSVLEDNPFLKEERNVEDVLLAEQLI